jgi:DNA-binding winged helix-turn-helix (wHTH) protein
MKNIVAEPARYSSSYRLTEVRQVMDWIKAGQCGCLLHAETQRYHLGNTNPDFAFVFLDLMALIDQTDWAIYELMLDRILSQLRPLLEETAAQELTALHREVTHSKDPLIAQRAIERSLDILCQPPTRRIILLLDAFDTAFATLEPSAFLHLRTIRNAHKDQLCYLVITEKDLDYLREDLSQVEPFYRLVSRNVCYLGPYNDTDARQMIRYLAFQRSKKLSAEATTQLIKFSGGHASLLKAILGLHWDIHEKDILVETTLNNKAKIQAQCQRLWESLSKNEQRALCALRDGREIDRDTRERLKLRGLVSPSQANSNSLFSPLFSYFIRQQAASAINGVVLKQDTREVQIAGRRIDNLTELEFNLLRYFCDHPGRLCNKDELIANLYAEQEKAAQGVTDETLLAVISRLRKKIEPNPKRPLYLLTVRGQGYRFVEPDDKEPPASPRPHLRGR